MPGTLTVSPAALTVTANNQTKVYGAGLPTLTLSYGGFVNGDTTASLTTQPTITTAATASSSVGAYPITANGAVDPNYMISYVPGTLTVTPAMLKITALNQTIPYAALPSILPALVHYSGFVNGDTPAGLTTLPTVTSTATLSSPVGSYPIVAGGAVDPNYAINYVAGTLSVTPAALTITVNNATKVYAAALPTFSVNYSGFKNGDTSASLTTQPLVTSKATAASSVGTYPISASGAVDPNYTFNYVAGTLTVTPATLTVTAVNQAKVYGQPVPTLIYFPMTGFVNGDTSKVVKGSPTLTTTATTLSPPGLYPITVTQGTLSANNYVFAFVTGEIVAVSASTTITLANVTVQTGAASATLKATVAAVSPSAATVKEGSVLFEVLNGSGTLLAFVSSAVANGSASATLDTSGLPAGTYSIFASYYDGYPDWPGNFNASAAKATLTRK